MLRADAWTRCARIAGIVCDEELLQNFTNRGTHCTLKYSTLRIPVRWSWHITRLETIALNCANLRIVEFFAETIADKHWKSTDDDRLFFIYVFISIRVFSFLFLRDFLRFLRSLRFRVLILFAFSRFFPNFSRSRWAWIDDLGLKFRIKKIRKILDIATPWDRNNVRNRDFYLRFFFMKSFSEFQSELRKATLYNRYCFQIATLLSTYLVILLQFPQWQRSHSVSPRKTLEIIYFMILHFKIVNLERVLWANASKILISFVRLLTLYVINTVYCSLEYA